jgi:hypothetical protein
MRAVDKRRDARTIGLALVAGFVAFEVAIAFGTGAVGIPGVYLLRFAKSADAPDTGIAGSEEGGESVVAKLAQPAASSQPSRQDAPPSGEPRLDGLLDIPLPNLVPDKAKPSDGKAFGEGAKTHDDLPWDAVEPVPFDPPAGQTTADATAVLPKQTQPDVPPAPLAPGPLAELPAIAAVQGWVKAKAIEIKGEDRPRPLYHFEFWLDAPEDVKQRLAVVAYEFNTPAVQPQSQISSEKKTGFRVSAGGLTCADNVRITLKFTDGRAQQVDVDGCKLLS